MRIRRKFLQLTKWTYPYGTEFTLESYLPNGVIQDNYENYYLVIGDNPTTMFACHLDTSCSRQEKVTHVQSDKIIRTNGKTILGADDKAGMTVILYMIENKIPGLYYFFVGEEVGCIGSGDVAGQWSSLGFDSITKVVSFDRRGTSSIITHQMYGRCCSDEFANELSKRFSDTNEGVKLIPDDTGMMTDSAKFTELVPECTNISVGYYKEHTVDEHQDIEFLTKLCKAVVKIDWETLPVKRDPSVTDYGDDYDDYMMGRWGQYSGYETKTENDEVFTTNNYVYVSHEGKLKKMLLASSKVAEEKEILSSWIHSTGSYCGMTDIYWNGQSLYVETDYGIEFVGNRFDIAEFLPELSHISKKHLSEEPKRELRTIVL